MERIEQNGYNNTTSKVRKIMNQVNDRINIFYEVLTKIKNEHGTKYSDACVKVVNVLKEKEDISEARLLMLAEEKIIIDYRLKDGQMMNLEFESD